MRNQEEKPNKKDRLSGAARALNVSLLQGLLAVLVLAILFLLGSVWVENSRLRAENSTLQNQVKELRDKSLIKPPVKSGEEIAANSLKDVQDKVPAVTDEDYILGSNSADVFIVGYADLECPYCKRFHSVLKDIEAEYSGRVAIVFRHLPLTNIHPAAEMEAVAATCVAEQKGDAGFFDYVDLIYQKTTSRGSSFTKEQMITLAVEQGAVESVMLSCMDSDQAKSRVVRDKQSASEAGINATPTSFLITKNGSQKVFSGDMPYSAVKAAVENLL